MYRLFKADRPSTDEDHEAQDPMQHAVKIALEEQAAQLASIAEEVKQKVAQVASNTIEKLRDFDPELASTFQYNTKGCRTTELGPMDAPFRGRNPL